MFSQRPWNHQPWMFLRQGGKGMADFTTCWQQSCSEWDIVLGDIQMLSDSIWVMSEI